MTQRKHKYVGWVFAGTLAGALFGFALDQITHQPHRGRYLNRVTDDAVRSANYPIHGAIFGACLGIAIDLFINGIPNRSQWRFSVRYLFGIICTLCLLAYGLRCYVQINSGN